MIKIFNRKNAFIFWTIFVFLLIAWPMPEGIETGTNNSDKIVHFFIFGIFAYLLALNLEKRYLNKRLIAIAIFISGSYAYLAEIIQNFIPGRNYSLFDWSAGFLGILFFLTVYYVRKK